MKVTTMQGKVIDVGALMAQNETAIAVGNANLNARGDLLGAGGKVVKKKEQIAKEYHTRNPNSVKSVSLKDVQADVFMSPMQAVEEGRRIKQEIDAQNIAIAKAAEAETVKGRKTIIDSDE